MVPAHIPADRVVDFDIFNPPGVEQELLHSVEKPAWRTGAGVEHGQRWPLDCSAR